MVKSHTNIINSLVLLTIVLLAVCVVPASSVVLNGTDIFAANSGQTIIIYSGEVTSYMLNLQTGNFIQGGIGGFGGGGAGGRGSPDPVTGVVKDYRSSVMAQQVIKYNYEYEKLNFEYERVDGTKITGYILLTPSSNPVFGERLIHINENNFNSTMSYPRTPILNTLYTMDLYTVVVVDPTTEQQYFKIDQRASPIYSFTSWDNATVANIPVSDMTKNPIYKCNFYSTKIFTITTYAESLDDYTKNLEDAIGTGVCEGNYWYCLLEWIFSPLRNAINDLSTLAGYVKGFYDGTFALAGFIFSVKIFIGLNAFYTAIAIILSIEDSDDLFKAFGKFISYERKLLRFYMEIFKAIKNIIKWW